MGVVIMYVFLRKIMPNAPSTWFCLVILSVLCFSLSQPSLRNYMASTGVHLADTFAHPPLDFNSVPTRTPSAPQCSAPNNCSSVESLTLWSTVCIELCWTDGILNTGPFAAGTGSGSSVYAESLCFTTWPPPLYLLCPSCFKFNHPHIQK